MKKSSKIVMAYPVDIKGNRCGAITNRKVSSVVVATLLWDNGEVS